jgi:hypothetical protein
MTKKRKPKPPDQQPPTDTELALAEASQLLGFGGDPSRLCGADRVRVGMVAGLMAAVDAATEFDSSRPHRRDVRAGRLSRPTGTAHCETPFGRASTTLFHRKPARRRRPRWLRRSRAIGAGRHDALPGLKRATVRIPTTMELFSMRVSFELGLSFGWVIARPSSRVGCNVG